MYSTSPMSLYVTNWNEGQDLRFAALDVEDAATGQRLAPVRQQGFREGPAGGKQQAIAIQAGVVGREAAQLFGERIGRGTFNS